MAEIKFTAFVDDVKDWMIKTSEPHREQVDGEWKTVCRTTRNVRAAYQVNIDFTQVQKGDRVRVEGNESTKKREYDGKTYYDLVCKATSVTKVVLPPSQESSFTPEPADMDAPF
jgi:hypothetical protein